MKKFTRILSAVLAVLTVLLCTAVPAFASEADVISNNYVTEKSSDIITVSPSYPEIGEPFKVSVAERESETFFYRWYINGIKINNSAETYTPVEDDLEKMVTVEVYDADAELVGVKNVFISKIPVIYIETENRKSIVSKDVKIQAQMDIQGNDEFNSEDVLYNGEIEIKGRGNTTWNQAKKPYKIKLDSKTDLFGMGKNKHWVLLSDPFDTSHLRNDIAYHLSGKMGLGYQDGTWVELILNGKDAGVYYVAEHIRVGSTRTDITDWEGVAEDAAKAIYKKNTDTLSEDDKDSLTDAMTEDLSWTTSDKFTYKGVEYKVSDYYKKVPNVTGGYLLESTNTAESPKFKTQKGVELEVNTPETISEDMKDYISSYVQAFENALYADDFCTEYNGKKMRYTEFIDVESFAKGVLLNDLFQNSDFGYKSTYFYKDVDGKLFYGPLWDMDWCFNYGTDSWTSGGRLWISRLLQDPVFMKELRKAYWQHRYTDIYDVIKEGGEIDTAYNKIYEAAVHNDKLWNSEVGFEENVADYKFRIQNKLIWLDSTLATLESSHSFLNMTKSADVSLAYNDNNLSISTSNIEPASFMVYVNGEFNQEVTDLTALDSINVNASDDDIISVVAYSSDNKAIGGNYIYNENYITALNVVSAPSQTVYSVGDSIDLSGLELKATYKDGSVKSVTPDLVYTRVTDSLDVQLYCYNKVTDKCGSVVLVLLCGSKSVTIPLTVNPREDYELVEQYIGKIPADTEDVDFIKYTAEAWEQYEALSKSAKGKVENYQILNGAIDILTAIANESKIIDCYHSIAMRTDARNDIIIVAKANANAVFFSFGTEATQIVFKRNFAQYKVPGIKKLGDIEFWTVRRGLALSTPNFTVSARYGSGSGTLYTTTGPTSQLLRPVKTFSGVSYPDCIFVNEDFNITFNYNDSVSKVKLVENNTVLSETEDLSSGITCSFAETGNHNVTLYYMCGERWLEYKSFDLYARETVEIKHISDSEHTYTAEITEPTCTEKGYTTHTCPCGDSYIDSYVDALDHDYGEWIETVPATCTQKGTEVRYCSRCDATETRETELTEHRYSAVITKPTCTEKGYTTYICSCGDSFLADYVNATGHIDGEWKVTKTATYTEDGEKTLYCQECGKPIRTETIPKLVGKLISVSIDNVEIKYKNSATIKPEIITEGNVDYTVRYESSNSKVVTVDKNGNIITNSKGTANITCIVTDEAGNTVTDTKTINVKFTFVQWLIWIFLFGFLWY